MTDSELAVATGKLHQQVNQRCHALWGEGVLTREVVDGAIRNRLVEGAR